MAHSSGQWDVWQIPIGSWGGACPEKGSSKRKRVILPHFYPITERTLFHPAAGSEHMCWLDTLLWLLLTSRNKHYTKITDFFTYQPLKTTRTFKHIILETRLWVSLWCSGWSVGLQSRNKRVRCPLTLLVSLSDKYPWGRYEPPYPPGYGLYNTSIFLQERWLCHWITYKGWYAIKQRNRNLLSYNPGRHLLVTEYPHETQK